MAGVTVIKGGKFSGVRFAAGVEIEGLAPLMKKLRTMEPRIAKKLERKAVRAAAKVVQREAIQLAPEKTGLLKRSIKVRALKRSRRNRGRVGARVVTGADRDANRGGTRKTVAWYAGIVELGTSKMAAQPYLRPALDRSEDEVRGVFRAALRQAIKDERVRVTRRVIQRAHV